MRTLIIIIFTFIFNDSYSQVVRRIEFGKFDTSTTEKNFQINTTHIYDSITNSYIPRDTIYFEGNYKEAIIRIFTDLLNSYTEIRLLEAIMKEIQIGGKINNHKRFNEAVKTYKKFREQQLLIIK